MHLKDPRAIERRSMKIIDSKLEQLDCSREEAQIIKRIVHATAEPDLAGDVVVSPAAVSAGVRALRDGARIITDVSMVQAGIRKSSLEQLDGRVFCFISDPEVARRARQENTTRSEMAMRRAAEVEDPKIFALGNAPTALFEVLRLVEAGKMEPALIIGTPVGFVGAAESKEQLAGSSVPHVTLRGRRGGSPVAVSAVNALLAMASDST